MYYPWWNIYILLICFPFFALGSVHWSSDVVYHTSVPVNASRYNCYRLLKPRDNLTALTVLLPPVGLHTGWLSAFPRTVQNLRQNNPADLVFFHTDWTKDQIASLAAQWPEAHILCVAHEDWTADRNFRSWEMVEKGRFGAGYRSMCRWYAVKIYPILYRMGYEYMIRLDADSELRKPILYNMVTLMSKSGAIYGFRTLTPEDPIWARGLPEAVRYWLAVQNMTPTYLFEYFTPKDITGLTMKGWCKMVYFNNFFITKLEWWLQPEVREWLQYLEGLNGFFRFRWGDHSVQHLTLGMYSPKEKVVEFGFEYIHKGAMLNYWNSGHIHLNST